MGCGSQMIDPSPSMCNKNGLSCLFFVIEIIDQNLVPKSTRANGEFLQSMGISIAKHRLEILKLARKDRKPSPRPISRVLNVIKKTKQCFSEYLRAWIRREKSSQALMVVPSSSSNRWKDALLKRNKTFVMPNNGGFGSFGSKEERLLLTNGTPLRFDSFSNPMVCDYHSFKEEKKDYDDDGEKVKWVSMFQNLKPT